MAAPALPPSDATDVVDFFVCASMGSQQVIVPATAYRICDGWLFIYNAEDNHEDDDDPPCLFVPDGTVTFMGRLIKLLTTV